MKNLLFICILAMVSGCVAEYPSDRYYGEGEHGWNHDNDGHYWRGDDRDEHHWRDDDEEHHHDDRD